MKNFLKVAGAITALGLIGGSVYMMQNQSARRSTGKKVLKVMNSAEDVVAKKMN